MPHSPFATLLKLVVTSPEGNLYTGVKTLLGDMLRDHEMLQMDTHPDALDALLASLAPSNGATASSQIVLDFLDACCARFVKGPIKYFDDLDAIRQKDTRSEKTYGPFSPLLMTLVEQWPFKGGKPERDNPAEPLAQWLAKLLYLLKLVGEDEYLLTAVRDALMASSDAAYTQTLKDSFQWKLTKQKAKDTLKTATGVDFSGSERPSASPVPMVQPNETPRSSNVADLELPPKEDEKHTGLNRWRKKDVEESLENGDFGDLLLCLCSKHTEIRLQAVNNIRQLMVKVEVSNTSR